MRYIYFLYQWCIAVPILVVLTILTALVTIAGSAIGNRDWWGFYPPMFWARCFCVLLLIRTEIRGRENIDKNTSYVFVANHQGAFDIFLIYGYLGHNFKWMMKKQLQSIPFVGAACVAAGHIMVDKSTPAKLKHTMQLAEQTLRGGMSLVVFPEGARTWTGAMRPFKRGAYQLAVEFSLPVVPLTIDGAFAVMPRTTYNFKPGKIILTIHPPIYPQENKGHDIEDLMKKSYAVIESALPLKG